MTTKGVEVVVVTRNSGAHIGACVASIVAAGALPIVVDNGSADNTLEIVRAKCLEAVIIATGENLGYGKAMNLGFREAKGEFVILSNPDVVFLKDSIRQMTEFLQRNPKIGITGPQQMFPDRSWQRSYGDLPGIWTGIKDATGITTLQNQVRRMFWPRRIDRKPKEVPYVDGAVLAVRRDAFSEMYGFDEDFFFYSDESDLCARLRKTGWGVVFFPGAEVIHVRGADSAKVDRSDRFVRYMVKSQSLLARKHLPAWKARVYSRLQVWHFIRLGFIYRLLQWFGREKSSSEYKLWMFDAYVRIWKEALRAPELMQSPSPYDPPNECKEAGKAN
jgi:N-acetylglucosaminyl-diphospho-decaprenol L-rhamnosyltransferase